MEDLQAIKTILSWGIWAVVIWLFYYNNTSLPEIPDYSEVQNDDLISEWYNYNKEIKQRFNDL